nr:hypothetical protein [Tanacetum cinerariifolium]
MFVKNLGYDPKQLMFYHYKLPDKSLDYGLRPLSCDADVVSLIKLVANCKEIEVFVECWLTSVNHQFLSPVKCIVEIEEIDDDALLKAHVVGSSKTLALCWINEADVGESSVDKNANVHEEQQTISANDYLIDDMYELDIDENLNLEDYTVYVHENVDEDMNVNADDENVNADDEYDSVENGHDHLDDEEGRGFSFSVQEQGVDQTVTPNVDLTDEALEVLDFDSFDSDVGDDTESITRRKLRKLRKIAKARVKAYAVETRRKIGIVKNNNERLQAKCKGNVASERSKVSKGNLSHVDMGTQTGNGVSHDKNKMKGQMLTAVSVDANNGIYPVAYGIVESESKESWTWFLSCLGEDLGLEANSNFTFITGRQKGLLPALKDLFPAAEHIYCVRHIHDNMNLIFKGGQYKELLWKCATATTEVHFKRAMDEFNGYNRMSHEWLRKIPPKHWSRSQFLVNEGRENQVVVNLSNKSCTCRKWEVSGIPCKHAVACFFNMTDNGMQVRQFWAKSQVPSRYIPPQVGRPGKKRKKSAGWANCDLLINNIYEGPLTPTVTKIINATKEKASQCVVVWNDDLFQVNEGRENQVVVNLSNKSCTCRKWEVSGIPCKHAVACFFNMTDNGMQVRQFWAKSQVPSRYIPPQVGRPGKKRKKSAGE